MNNSAKTVHWQSDTHSSTCIHTRKLTYCVGIQVQSIITTATWIPIHVALLFLYHGMTLDNVATRAHLVISIKLKVNWHGTSEDELNIPNSVLFSYLISTSFTPWLIGRVWLTTSIFLSAGFLNSAQSEILWEYTCTWHFSEWDLGGKSSEHKY